MIKKKTKIDNSALGASGYDGNPSRSYQSSLTNMRGRPSLQSMSNRSNQSQFSSTLASNESDLSHHSPGHGNASAYRDFDPYRSFKSCSRRGRSDRTPNATNRSFIMDEPIANSKTPRDVVTQKNRTSGNTIAGRVANQHSTKKTTASKKTNARSGAGMGRKNLKSIDFNFIPYNKNAKIKYLYFDDPNELCERLSLLVSSHNAGNTNHMHEISSIIEELRELKLIK